MSCENNNGCRHNNRTLYAIAVLGIIAWGSLAFAVYEKFGDTQHGGGAVVTLDCCEDFAKRLDKLETHIDTHHASMSTSVAVLAKHLATVLSNQERFTKDVAMILACQERIEHQLDKGVKCECTCDHSPWEPKPPAPPAPGTPPAPKPGDCHNKPGAK